MSPNDWTDCYFAPNGIVTYEDCPVCSAPDMRVRHGKSGRGSFQHFEHCTECGDLMPIVCYDCTFCKITLGANMKSSDWLAFDAATTDARARELAAARLNVPESTIETLRTGGGMLARVKRKETR